MANNTVNNKTSSNVTTNNNSSNATSNNRTVVNTSSGRYKYANLILSRASAIPTSSVKMFNNTPYKIINGTDVIKYLDLQSYGAIKRDFKNISKANLDLIFSIKKDLLKSKKELFKTYNTALSQKYSTATSGASNSNTSSTGARSALIQQVQNPDEVQFKTIDGVPSTPGFVTIGSQSQWCGDDQFILTSIKHTSSTKSDLACITASNGQIYVSSLNRYGFSESHRIDASFAVVVTAYDPNSGEGSNPPIQYTMSDYTQQNFRESYFIGDFNGDGKDEIGLSHSDGLRIYRMDTLAGGGSLAYNWVADAVSFNEWSVPKTFFCNNVRGNSPIQVAGVRVGDFNGDGKDDLFCHDSNSGSNNVVFNSAVGEGHDYNWYTPEDFELNFISWCQGGYVYIADMDANGKADVICIKENPYWYSEPRSIYILYSAGDGRFLSKTGIEGDGLLPQNTVNAQFAPWSFSTGDNWGSVNDFMPRVRTGDFDGDGYSDLWYSKKDQPGSEYFLFSSPLGFFGSRSQDVLSGKASLNQLDINAGWCKGGEYPVMLTADFNGDGKTDLLCNIDPGSNLLMLSATKRIYDNNYKISVKVSNYVVADLTPGNESFKTLSHSIKCNNTVRPDDKLGCEAKISSHIQDINSLTTNFNILQDNIHLTSVVHDGIATFRYLDPASNSWSKKQIQISWIENTKESNIESSNSLNSTGHLAKEQKETLESLTTMQVKSGECIKMIMESRYISNLKVPYTATASLTAIDKDNETVTDVALQNLGEDLNLVDASLSTNEDALAFTLTGEVNIDLVVGTSHHAQNC